jgi:NADH-quinone oxidoreductase subunit F
VGLFGKPTVINNVETLVNALDIVLQGGPGFAETGTGQSKGPKLFCVSGSVVSPGVYEVPFGATLRELIELAGGVTPGQTLKAVLLGGAAGGFVTADELDVPLTFEGTRAIGASLGSGVVMVLDQRVNLVDFIQRIAAFFRDESCGQCVPCRVGTQRQEESLQRLASNAPLASNSDEIMLIDEIALVMRDASICGLGQTAASAVQSAIQKLGLFRGGVA